MNRLRTIYWIGIVLLVACTQQAPQRPSQRKGNTPAVDSTALALMEINQQLTEAADQLLLRMARTQEPPYALYERGTWARIVQTGDTQRPIRHGEECTMHMRIYSLNGTLYCDTEITAVAGKYELPAAVDENITEWHHGAQIQLLAPWYAAFGIKGTEYVPPYENVMIELDIKE